MMRRWRIFFSVLCFLCGAALIPYTQSSPETLSQWAQQLVIDARVLDELRRFEHKKERLAEQFATQFSARIRELVISSPAQYLRQFQEGQCQPFITVEYMQAGSSTKDANLSLPQAAKKFAENVVRVEVVACFPEAQHSAAEALRLYTSREFRMAASSAIKQVLDEQGLSCVRTKGYRPLVRPTYYCNRITEFHQDGLAIQHSQTLSNKDDSSYQHVFFKESLKTFMALPKKGLAFHYINYSRSDNLNSLKKALGKKAILHSQRGALEKLRKQLRTQR